LHSPSVKWGGLQQPDARDVHKQHSEGSHPSAEIARYTALTKAFTGKPKSNLRNWASSKFKKLINLCIHKCSEAPGG